MLQQKPLLKPFLTRPASQEATNNSIFEGAYKDLVQRVLVPEQVALLERQHRQVG